MPGSDARRGLELVDVGGVGEGLLRPLGRELDRRFGTRAFTGPPLPLDPGWRDAESGQYGSGEVVDALVSRAEALGFPRLWSLGVTGADLGAPGRTFVFGEATVGGCCAVVSTARLEGGGGAGRLRARLLSEAVHELGHVAGLEHCEKAGCVMHPSAVAEEVDRRGADFCADCEAALRRASVDLRA
ncbi:MAG TPA: matrixin family metalloprotease [Longimicrobiaceae bacterium]